MTGLTAPKRVNEEGQLVRTCTCCQKEFPETTEYFYNFASIRKASTGPRGGTKGWVARCKVCDRKIGLARWHTNKEKCKKHRDEVRKAYVNRKRKEINTTAAKWRKNNPEKALMVKLKVMGIKCTEKQVSELIIKRRGLCDICGKPESIKKLSNLAIDHDHLTGNKRGLLCYRCNLGIGYFKENIEIMKKAIMYIKKHQDLLSEPSSEPGLLVAAPIGVNGSTPGLCVPQTASPQTP